MSYRHDRRRKLIRRWQREGWQQLKSATIDGGRIYTAAPGTLPSVGGINYAAHMANQQRTVD
jgi:hypothetical protein